ncbi:lysosome-associated membrane glycoprotein 1a [Pygocentrus nattereri]|uniref:Lysosome-associated membrane glycoprotein 1 n=1 Tax=Pygocentrus nattereri TaxID=42514 RepID=A0A3B4DNL0_PYGNA|nr:lysosome-associated membrane glycoprotein 1a [Pygocentrus nattereri]
MSRALRAAALAAAALLGWLAVAHAVSFEVKDGNSTCIKAELSANFSITYTTASGTKTVIVPLTDSAVVGSGSSCGGSGVSPELLASFGDGHSLGLVFSKDDRLYRVLNLSLTYNLSDSTIFPLSSKKEIVTLETKATGISAQLNTTYRCLSSSSIRLGSEVTVTFSDVRMEAYMPSANLSSKETVCSADFPATTAAPTQSPTTAPTPPAPGNPEVGSYNITNVNGSLCLLANMGLQLNVTYFSKSQNKTVKGIVNLQPNRTSFTGSCEAATVTLVLMYDLTNLSFTFTLNDTSNKYHLSAVNVSAAWSDMMAPFTVSNSSLNYLQGTQGRSYMCTAEQTLPVTNTFSLNTFKLQVQPFKMSGNKFGTAEECQMDKDNMLIPIVVGAALAGLVLIVLIAYLIGRKRSHAGYQTI